MSKWNVVSLGDVCRINPPKKESASFKADDDVTFLPMQNIKEYSTDMDLSISAPYREVSKGSYTYFRDRDVLLAKVTPCFENGKSGIANGLKNGIGFGSSELHTIRAGELITPDFVFRVITSKQFHSWAVPKMTGTGGLRRVPADVVRDFRFALPPLEEQKRIAAILDTADIIRTKRKEAIAKLDQLAQSVFLEMFGESQCRHWEMLKVNDILKNAKNAIRTGPFGSQLLHSEFVENGIAVLGIDNVVTNDFVLGSKRFISEAKYNELKRYAVFPGDVLITIMGTCGKCAIVPDRIGTAINTKHLCCLTPDYTRYTSIFVKYWFLHHPIARKYLESQTKGAIMDGLNMGIIRSMPIPRPPKELQELFTQKITQIDLLRGSHTQALNKECTLFSSLQHQAFSGSL